MMICRNKRSRNMKALLSQLFSTSPASSSTAPVRHHRHHHHHHHHHHRRQHLSTATTHNIKHLAAKTDRRTVDCCTITMRASISEIKAQVIKMNNRLPHVQLYIMLMAISQLIVLDKLSSALSISNGQSSNGNNQNKLLLNNLINNNYQSSSSAGAGSSASLSSMLSQTTLSPVSLVPTTLNYNLQQQQQQQQDNSIVKPSLASSSPSSHNHHNLNHPNHLNHLNHPNHLNHLNQHQQTTQQQDQLSSSASPNLSAGLSTVGAGSSANLNNNNNNGQQQSMQMSVQSRERDDREDLPSATVNNHSRNNHQAVRPPQYVDVSALVSRERNSSMSSLSPKSRSGLPECATQQVCNAIFVRMNYTQKLCECSSNYNWKCSFSPDAQDGHTIELTRKFDKRIYTQIKTCEPLREVRACKSPTDWTLLALQSERSGKAHYVVVCKCPTWAQLEGPYTHNHPPYANIPGIRVYGMLCAHQTARSNAFSAFNPQLSPYPEFPWSEALSVLNSTNIGQQSVLMDTY